MAGSTHVYTPEQFVDDLKVLELSGIGSRANPRGIRDQDYRSFQEYYDEKYFIQDEAPPQAFEPAVEQRRTPVPQAPYLMQSDSMSSMQSADSAGTKASKLKKKHKLFGFA